MQHRGPRPDLDVFRPLFYLGKLPEAPKSPRPVTPLLLSNPAPNADGHKMFFWVIDSLSARMDEVCARKTQVCHCGK